MSAAAPRAAFGQPRAPRGSNQLRLAPRGLALFAAVFWISACPAPAVESAPPIDFDRDVRPILSDKCYQCHGPDGEARQAELRLDTRDGLLESVVVPGDAENSELALRIGSQDDDMRMPPPASGLSLSSTERDAIVRWIEQGAEVSEHWAFRPLPREVAVPPTADAAWPRSPIDQFVLFRLQQERLTPSRQAEPLRLLRRLSFDLTGLPPTPEEIAAFKTAAANDLDAAVAAAVDRLLASPAYGEHQAVPWLDAARYADSHGYQSDQLNTQWPYRDWVVRAFNANMPYDEFLTRQLAGDLLPHATDEDRLATAFNRLHRMTNEGGSIFAEWQFENAVDRTNTFGYAVLGLTLECARCHDHKYDPIPQRDYYAMLAFFNSIDETGLYDRADKVPSPSLLLPTAEQRAALAAAHDKLVALEDRWAKRIAGGESDKSYAAWRESLPDDEPAAAAVSAAIERDRVAAFSFDGDFAGGDGKAEESAGSPPAADQPPAANQVVVRGGESAPGYRGQAVRFDGDAGVELPGLPKVDRWDRFTIDVMVRDEAANPDPVVLLHRTYGTDVGYNGLDLVLAGGALEARCYRIWPGNGFGVRVADALPQGQWRRVTLTYDGSSRAAGLKVYLDGQLAAAEVLRDRIWKQVGVAAHGSGNWELGARFRDRGFREGSLDELSFYARDLTPLEVAVLSPTTPEGRARLLPTRGAEQREGRESGPTALAQGELCPPGEADDALREFYFSALDPPSQRLAAELQEARRQLVAAEDVVQETAIMEELPQPRPTHVMARGAYDAPRTDDNLVERSTFAQIGPPYPQSAPRDRLGLARWATLPDHPLTARVIVNRVWAQFFGVGLTGTPENLGRQGDGPSHPQLLDWLARDLVDHGWDVKRLCRQIALSATYRQDSRRRPELLKRDPENRLLARGPSRRLSAEELRDAALAASGLLAGDVGGPPVSPYQPGEDLWREANGMSPPYQESVGPGLHRRSLYSVWKRTAPLPNMTALDALSREVCVIRRTTTNTPLQALVLLNDVQFVEAARALAATVARREATLEGRIDAAFMRLAGRPPTAEEQQVLAQVYDEQLRQFSPGGEQDPAKFLALGEFRPTSELPPPELAALATVCQTILNSDAAVYER